MVSQPSKYDNVDSRYYGVVLEVKNLDSMRCFYCRILELGNPVVESNFWLEFQDPANGMIIALQQTNAAVAGQKNKGEHIAVCIQVKSLDQFRKKLAKHGITDVREDEIMTGKSALSFFDPEGNHIMALAADE